MPTSNCNKPYKIHSMHLVEIYFDMTNPSDVVEFIDIVDDTWEGQEEGQTVWCIDYNKGLNGSQPFVAFESKNLDALEAVCDTVVVEISKYEGGRIVIP